MKCLSVRHLKKLDHSGENAHRVRLAKQNPKQNAKGIAIWVSASKAAMVMLTQVLAVELGHINVQVNAIAPGIIKTRFSHGMQPRDNRPTAR